MHDGQIMRRGGCFAGQGQIIAIPALEHRIAVYHIAATVGGTEFETKMGEFARLAVDIFQALNLQFRIGKAKLGHGRHFIRRVGQGERDGFSPDSDIFLKAVGRILQWFGKNHHAVAVSRIIDAPMAGVIHSAMQGVGLKMLVFRSGCGGGT